MSIHAQLLRICSFIALCSPALLSQVEVTVRTEKPDYIVGEPVIVVVGVRNVGSEPVGYGKGFGIVNLTVQGVERQARNVGNCFLLVSRWPGGGEAVGSHPPQMKPGETVSFRYLLKGYPLPGGNYVMRAEGRAGVLWTSYPAAGPNPPPPKHPPGEPVPGAAIDVEVPLRIRDGSEEELRSRFAPYIEDAENSDWERRILSREAIAEMAPGFLEKMIMEFAGDPNFPHLAVEGLRKSRTPESRNFLMEMFDKTVDLRLRADIVRALAEMATPDQFEFFASLLPGRSTKLDDDIRKYAAFGLGQIGGDRAVNALINTPRSPNPEFNAAIIVALGNTKSRKAFPALFDLYSDSATRNDVCGALASATHLTWCDGSGEVEPAQSKWRKWWKRNGSTIRLYGPEECSESVINSPFYQQYSAPNEP